MMRVAIFGTGKHAGVVVDILEKQSQCMIAGFIGRTGETSPISEYPFLGTDEKIESLSNLFDSAIVAIGDNWTRACVVHRICSACPSLTFFTAIHPSAVVGRGVTIAEGTVVMAGAVVNPNSNIGRHCIVNTNSSVDHDNHIHDFASVGPGAVTGGGVTLGTYSAIGLGACVAESVRIGKNSVIGAGATVVRDIPDSVIAFGTPARVIRSRALDEPYLR